MFAFVQLLLDERKISSQYKDHGLVGEWKQCGKCHIEPDWLLIYSITPEEIIVHRTGSHAELFGKLFLAKAGSYIYLGGITPMQG